jgi:hypothetical protein
MRARALYLLAPDGQLLLSRHFPTVELTYQRQAGGSYQSLPSDVAVAEAVYRQLSAIADMPVLTLKFRATDEGKKSSNGGEAGHSRREQVIWPVVHLRRQGAIFVIILSIMIMPESTKATSMSLGMLPEITESLSFLGNFSTLALPYLAHHSGTRSGVADMATAGWESATATTSSAAAAAMERTHAMHSDHRLPELHVLLSASMPFGSPVDCDPLWFRQSYLHHFHSSDNNNSNNNSSGSSGSNSNSNGNGNGSSNGNDNNISSSVKSAASTTMGSQTVTTKTAAWRSLEWGPGGGGGVGGGKGRKLTLLLVEEVEVGLYDRQHHQSDHPDFIQDVCRLRGSLFLATEGGAPSSLQIPLTLPRDSALSALLLAPCIDLAASRMAQLSETGSATLCLSQPPVGSTQLASWTVDRWQPPPSKDGGDPSSAASSTSSSTSVVQLLPWRGIYQMRWVSGTAGVGDIEFLLQLKLAKSLQTSVFEMCRIELHFSSNVTLRKPNTSASLGTVSLSPDRRSLSWVLGHKIPAREKGLTLRGTVSTQSAPILSAEESRTSEHLMGDSSFAKVVFRLVNRTLSQIDIDSKAISTGSGPVWNCGVEKEVASGEYLIWSSKGKVRHANAPSEDELQDIWERSKGK